MHVLARHLRSLFLAGCSVVLAACGGASTPRPAETIDTPLPRPAPAAATPPTRTESPRSLEAPDEGGEDSNVECDKFGLCKVKRITRRAQVEMEARADREDVGVCFHAKTTQAQLDSIRYIPWIRWVGIEGSAEKLDLAPIGALTEVRGVYLGRCDSPRSGSWADSPIDVGNFAALGRLPRLEHLWLIHASKVFDVSGIEASRSLRDLRIIGAAVADLAPIAKVASLRALHLENIPAANLAPLGGAAELEDLTLNKAPIADLAPLVRAPKLRSISLSELPANDLSMLGGTVLTNLRIAKMKLQKPLAISARALGSLSLEDTDVDDLRTVAQLDQLTSLSLNRSEVRDLSPLAGMRKLQYLYISGTPVEDLGPLAKLWSLYSLTVSDTKVTKLDALRSLPRLSQLDVSTTKVTDLGPLAQIPTLDNLNVSTTAIKSLAPLAKNRALRYLNVSETNAGSLAPIATLPALERIQARKTKIDGLAKPGALPMLESVVVDKSTSEAQLAELRRAYPNAKIEAW